MPQPPHHGDRQPLRLALDQVPGRGQLVGRGHDRGAERIAVRVRPAPQIVQHTYPRRPDRDVGQPVAPGPTKGVRDDDADLHAEGVPQPVPDGPGGDVGVLRQQQHGPGRRVRRVDPGGGQDQPLPVLHDPQRPAPGHDPHGLGVYGGLAVGGPEDPALGLGNDLRGDEHDVPVDQAGLGRGDQLGEIVTGPNLGNPAQRPDPKRGCTTGSRSTTRSPRPTVTSDRPTVASPRTTATSPRPTVASHRTTVTDASRAAPRAAHARTSSARSNACRAISAVASTSVIISGTARQRIPAASTSPTAPASTVSTSQPSSSPEP